jgi:hypothetical protein
MKFFRNRSGTIFLLRFGHLNSSNKYRNLKKVRFTRSWQVSEDDVQMLGVPPSLTVITQDTIGAPKFGRRKGDYLMLAFSYAVQRGDLFAAGQLLQDYQALRDQLPIGVAVDRRKPKDHSPARAVLLWRRIRAGFVH